MKRYIVKQAGPEHDRELSEMSKIAMPGTISLALEKAPSYLAAMRLSGDKTAVYVCIDTVTNSIVGSFSLGERLRALEGNWVPQKYFSDLRITPSQRGSRVLYYIMGFIANRGLLNENEMAEAIIFSDNAPMIRYAESSTQRKTRMEVVPIFHFGHNYITYTLSPKASVSRTKSAIAVRSAKPEDLKAMRVFYEQEALQRDSSHYVDWNGLGSGHYAGLRIEDFMIAHKNGEILGIMAAWDQSSLKSIRVKSYRKPLAWFRPLLNSLSPIIGQIPLPPAGSCLNVLNATPVCVSNNYKEVFKALLEAHLRKLKAEKSDHLLQIGLDETSPFNSALKNIRQKHVTRGTIYYLTQGRNYPQVPSCSQLAVGRI